MKRIASPSAPDVKVFGALTIVAYQTVDGGYSIRTFTGPHREATLCLTTPDRDLARLAYKVIAEGGASGVQLDGIRAALSEALRYELNLLLRREDSESQARAEHIHTLLDVVDPVSPADLDRLAASVFGERRAVR